MGNSVQLYEVHEEGRLNKFKNSFMLMILHYISFIYNVHRNPDNKFWKYTSALKRVKD